VRIVLLGAIVVSELTAPPVFLAIPSRDLHAEHVLAVLEITVLVELLAVPHVLLENSVLVDLLTPKHVRRGVGVALGYIVVQVVKVIITEQAGTVLRVLAQIVRTVNGTVMMHVEFTLLFSMVALTAELLIVRVENINQPLV